MRRISIFLISTAVTLGILSLFFFQGSAAFWNAPLVSPSPTDTELIAPVPTIDPKAPERLITKPVRLEIEKLNIASEVEWVGLAADGRMDVPKQDENVGWFELGAKPGETGNSVLAGHFDSKDGGPAVFYELGKLQPGDEVIVVDENSQKRVFVVEKIANFEDATFPIEAVFGGSTKPQLNLITCAGTFDRTSNNYSNRLVVFTTLKNDS